MILYGQPVPTGYEGAVKGLQAPYERIPYFYRRPIAFYLGWNLPIYVHPLYPTALKPAPRFFPVLLASTFNDYYVYNYSRRRQVSGGPALGLRRGRHVGCLWSWRAR